MAILSDSVSQVHQIVDKAKEKHAAWKPDRLHQRLSSLLEGKVGPEYPLDDLERHHKDAEQRYRMSVPPGYDEKHKSGTGRFGDYIIWRQLIDKAKELNDKPFVFVTDDSKEDWWHKRSGETLGPRPELIQELYREARVQFYMYTGDKFIERALSFLGPRIDIRVEDRAKAVDEARQVTEEGVSKTIELPLAVPINETTWMKRPGRVHFRNGRHAEVEMYGMTLLPRSYSDNGISVDYYIFQRLDKTEGKYKGDIARHCVRDGLLLTSETVATNADVIEEGIQAG